MATSDIDVAALPAVRVRSVVGDILAEVAPVPATVGALKAALEEVTGCSEACQQLLAAGGSAEVLGDDDLLQQMETSEVLLIIDETPMSSWDLQSNPALHMLLAEDGGHLKCPKLESDYVNVFTMEPVRRGVHYFEFVMHYIGDEQWCGIAKDKSQAGPRISGRRLEAWAYYVGRMGCRRSSLVDGHGSLHAEHKAVKEFQSLQPEGDVIGMLVDMEQAAVAFDLNGSLQGACPIPRDVPMWVFTHVDTRKDHVELRKLSLHEAPQESLETMSKALLDVTKGVSLSYRPFGGHSFDAAQDSDSSVAGSDNSEQG